MGPNKHQHNEKNRLRYETRPGLVALYDIRPGNGAGPFLQPRSPHGDGGITGQVGFRSACDIQQYRCRYLGYLKLSTKPRDYLLSCITGLWPEPNYIQVLHIHSRSQILSVNGWFATELTGRATYQNYSWNSELSWNRTQNVGFVFSSGSLLIRVYSVLGSEYFQKVRFMFSLRPVNVGFRSEYF